ncbi:MAG: hypothetical protein JWO76_917 [Nocardioides sp.]|nr:hypothetical protein [Nocardioides sp.]
MTAGKRPLGAWAGLLLGSCFLAYPSFAVDGSSGPSTHTETNGNGFTVHSSDDSADGGGVTTDVSDVSGQWQHQPMCDTGGAATCVDFLTCPDGTPVIHWWFVTAAGQTTSEDYVCPDEALAQPQITSDIVLRALRRIDLPKSQLIVQPPGGETLVNFATNFYTEQGPFNRTVRLLGQRVDLKIWPSQFGWRFGDGRTLATQSAGAPYPDLEITHEYARKGGVRPSVDTTYAAQFRVNGGPWRDVNGTVTIPGNPVQLQVRTASPILVGYH